MWGPLLLIYVTKTGAVEFSAMQLETLNRLKAGRDVLQELNRELNLIDVEKLMDDTADAIAYQNVGFFICQTDLCIKQAC